MDDSPQRSSFWNYSHISLGDDVLPPLVWEYDLIDIWDDSCIVTSVSTANLGKLSNLQWVPRSSANVMAPLLWKLNRMEPTEQFLDNSMIQICINVDKAGRSCHARTKQNMYFLWRMSRNDCIYITIKLCEILEACTSDVDWRALKFGIRKTK